MKVNALKKCYGGRTALDVPGFELSAGSVCALIGANGSGKSTLAKILAGVITADGGKAAFDRPVNVAYMPQKSFGFRMSAEKNIRLGGGDRAAAAEMLEKLGMQALAKKSAKSLSGGELARLALGRVLMERHEVLILDEPAASMDMESTLLAEKLIRQYAREKDCAVLLVTHSLAQARRLADEAMFLKEGRILESGPAEKVLRQPENEETRRFLEFYGE